MCPLGCYQYNSCTWEHDVRLHIERTKEPKTSKKVKQDV